MALTLAELSDLLSGDPTQSLTKGSLRAFRMQHLKANDYVEHALLDELMATPTRPPVMLTSTPWADVRPRHESSRKPLGEADYAWLNRLSEDPTEITDDEARDLHRMLLEQEVGSPEARLLAKIFGPVERLHEARAAEANRKAMAKAAGFPVPPIPARAQNLVFDAIQREHPELRGNEVEARAREVIAEANARRSGQEGHQAA